MPRTAETEAKQARALELWRKGEAPTAISERLGTTPRVVRLWIQRAGGSSLLERATRESSTDFA